MLLWQDIRYGFLMLAASPGFTTVAVLSLMGVEPTIGRAFGPEEDEAPGRDAVLILGRTATSATISSSR